MIAVEAIEAEEGIMMVLIVVVPQDDAAIVEIVVPLIMVDTEAEAVEDLVPAKDPLTEVIVVEVGLEVAGVAGDMIVDLIAEDLLKGIDGEVEVEVEEEAEVAQGNAVQVVPLLVHMEDMIAEEIADKSNWIETNIEQRIVKNQEVIFCKLYETIHNIHNSYLSFDRLQFLQSSSVLCQLLIIVLFQFNPIFNFISVSIS